MDFIIRFLDTIMVFGKKGNLVVFVLFLFVLWLLSGLLVETIIYVGRKTKASKRLKRHLKWKRVL